MLEDLLNLFTIKYNRLFIFRRSLWNLMFITNQSEQIYCNSSI